MFIPYVSCLGKQTRVSGNPDSQIAKPNLNSLGDQDQEPKFNLLRSQNLIFFEERNSKCRCVLMVTLGLWKRLGKFEWTGKPLTPLQCPSCGAHLSTQEPRKNRISLWKYQRKPWVISGDTIIGQILALDWNLLGLPMASLEGPAK